MAFLASGETSGAALQLGFPVSATGAAPTPTFRNALHTLLTDPRFSTAAARAADRITVEDPDRAAGEALERIAHEP